MITVLISAAVVTTLLLGVFLGVLIAANVFARLMDERIKKAITHADNNGALSPAQKQAIHTFANEFLLSMSRK